MRYAVLNNTSGAAGNVENVAVAEAPLNDGWIELAENSDIAIGWMYDGAEFTFTAPPQSTAEQYIGSMKVLVNAITVQRFVGFKNTPALFRVECSLPINDTFAVPLAGLFGAQGKTFMFEFENGIAERQVVFEVSGEWVVTEDQINAHLSQGQHFQFDGLNISIAE
jgi:hypothetical protein